MVLHQLIHYDWTGFITSLALTSYNSTSGHLFHCMLMIYWLVCGRLHKSSSRFIWKNNLNQVQQLKGRQGIRMSVTSKSLSHNGTSKRVFLITSFFLAVHWAFSFLTDFSDYLLSVSMFKAKINIKIQNKKYIFIRMLYALSVHILQHMSKWAQEDVHTTDYIYAMPHLVFSAAQIVNT